MKRGLAFLLAAIVGVTLGLLAACYFQIITVGDDGMTPTLTRNSQVLVNRKAYTSKSPSYGDLVLVSSSSWVHGQGGEGSQTVKRIVGCPGDRIAIYQGAVYVNGYALNEDYLKGLKKSHDIGVTKLMDSQYFVVGDNRDISTDSRSEGVGSIDKDKILGEVIIW